MVDRLAQQVVLSEPARCRRMQPRDAFGLVAGEPALQELGEQVVVAKPLAVIIESTQEQVSLLGLLQ